MDTKIPSELLASFIAALCGRSVEVIKAPDDESDDEVRISDSTWVQVGGFYAIVFRKVNGRHLQQDCKNLYEVVEALRHLDPDCLVPSPSLLQF